MKSLQKMAAVLTAIAALGMTEAPASAFGVTQNNNTSDLLNTLLGDTNGLSNFSSSITGNANAFGVFQDDPFGLNSGIVMSTGQVVQLPGVNSSSAYSPDLGTSFGLPGDPSGSYDLAKLDISFDADSTVDKLYFEYVFGSEEFVEWAGSSFNDSFELLLNDVNLAKLSDGQTVTINNLASSSSEPFHPDYINNPAGPGTATKLDGYTKNLLFEGLLKQNATNTLTIKIKDQADGVYDSAVFLKGGSLGTVKSSQSVPEPGTITGLVFAAGIAGAAGRRAKSKKS